MRHRKKQPDSNARVITRKGGRELRRLTVYLPIKLARSVSVRCAEEDRDLSGAIAEAVDAWLRKPGLRSSTMGFPATVRKAGQHWLAEASPLDVLTQGRNRREAITMLAGAIEALVNKKGFRIQIKQSGNSLRVTSNDDTALAAIMKVRNPLNQRP